MAGVGLSQWSRGWRVVERLIAEDAGQDLIEYGLLGGVVILAGITFLPSIISKASAAYSNWGSNVQNIWVPCDPGVTPPC